MPLMCITLGSEPLIKAMKPVLQDHSTCTWSLEQHIKIKSLYYNKHFKPLMCITLGSNTLRL